MKKAEQQIGDSAGPYKAFFELTWREYFRLYVIHKGRSVFFLEGPAGRTELQWVRDEEMEDADGAQDEEGSDEMEDV